MGTEQQAVLSEDAAGATERGTRDTAVSIVRQREIVEAAVKCFERWGISRTRVDDIAVEAGMARSQIYKQFNGKDAIVLAVIMESIRQHNRAMREQIPLRGPSDRVILDSMVIVIRHAIENRLTAALLNEPESPHVTARALAAQPEVMALLEEYWSGVFDYARRRGELKAHFDPASATRWVIFVQLSYLALPELIPDTDEALIADLQDYFLPGLLPANDSE